MPKARPAGKSGSSSQPYPFRKHLRNFFLITLGSLISSAAYVIFVSANGLLAGGVWGVAAICNHFLPVLPMGLFVFLLNLPLLFWGWRRLSLRFVLYTVYAVLLQSGLLLFLPAYLPRYCNEPLLACLFGGLLLGLGGGLVVRAHGSGGGTDIVGIILKDKYDISVGSISLTVNAVVVLLAGFIFGFEPAMYTMVELYVNSVVFNQVLEGLNRKRTLLIVTEHGEALAERLLHEFGRGVTMLPAEGGYTHRPKQLLICVLSRFELAGVKEAIHQVDPAAFISISETHEVVGRFRKSRELPLPMPGEISQKVD